MTAVTEAVLVDAIEADRDAAAPYLVYADWLSQRGDPRGELIVVQDELARTTDPERQALLRAREQELLEAHLAEWMGGEVRGPRIKLTWQRGFLDELYLDYREADTGGLARLVRSPLCRLVRTIHLRTHVREGLPEVLASPVLRHLETLSLGSYRFESYSTRGIATAFPGLVALGCDSSALDLDELQFPELRSLSVALEGWKVANLEAIAGADLPRLEYLQIWGGYMQESRSDDDDDDDDAPWFPADRCRRLFDAMAFPALRTLRFDSGGFGDELVDALAGSTLLRQLDELVVDDSLVTPAGHERLRQARLSAGSRA
jgi:uncharacterized protein (TIGR02996 family)